ncbi:MAG: cytochrome c [Alphaproteobacteria bacterium]|nr:cytochrome c [Alphaproteobacteria bacterium]
MSRRADAWTAGAVVAVALHFAPAAQAGGDPPDPMAGEALAAARCAECHAIGRTGESPVAVAPPFRTLQDLWPLANLAEALAEGIVTGHPQMPETRLEPGEIDAFLAYLETLSR